MIHSSAILKSTAMDTTNVAATTTETVAKINAFTRRMPIPKIAENGKPIKDAEGKQVYVYNDVIFVAINDHAGIKIGDCDFGEATGMILMMNEYHGVSAVDAILKSALRTEATFGTEEVEEEDGVHLYTKTLSINVSKSAVTDYLEFYKMLNA